MKTVLILVVALLITIPAFADTPRSTAGAKVDAPNLVRLTDNLTFGIEAGKDMGTNIFQDSAAWREDDKNYFVYAKITYTGTLLNFAK